MKKLVLISLAIILVAGTVLVSCGEEAAPGPAPAPAPAPAPEQPGKYVVIEPKIPEAPVKEPVAAPDPDGDAA